MFRVTRRPPSGAQNCNCSLRFYVRFWLPATAMAEPSQRLASKNIHKTRGCNYSFELLMMGGMSPKTCWAIKKHWNNKFYYTVASCWFFLWVLYYDTRIREHQPNFLLHGLLALYTYYYSYFILFYFYKEHFTSVQSVYVKFVTHNLKVPHHLHVCDCSLKNNISCMRCRYVYSLRIKSHCLRPTFHLHLIKTQLACNSGTTETPTMGWTEEEEVE